MNGNLIVRVYADTIAQPVENAEVRIVGEGVDMPLVTDSSGETESVSLPAPPVELSLTPSDQIVYSRYTVTVTRSGLGSETVKGVEVFPGVTSYQDVYLNSTNEGDVTIDIPDFYVGSYPPKIPEEPLEPKNSRVLPKVIIPEYVVVHDGLPTNTAAANYTVPYTDYIKNVACSEIYSTWPTETIKANVLAINSMTLNRVYTEWYPSKGYNFTITSSTQYDQKFVYGRTIFDTISKVVDQIFTQYIARNGTKFPFFAQYCDGKIVNRANWLSQWGSEELGRKGYTALQILNYYYANQVHIETATQVEGLPNSFPGYKLDIGACGREVQQLQNELNVIRGSYPAIPVINKPDGNYDTQTKNSVKVFQKVFGLSQTGVVDYATWYKISAIYVAIAKLMEGIH